MTIKQDKQKYWKQHYDSYQKLKSTQRAYCSQNNLNYWTFNQWKRRFDKAELDTNLQEIPVEIFQNDSSENQIEIIVKNNIRISIPDDFSPKTLKNILSIIGENS